MEGLAASHKRAPVARAITFRDALMPLFRQKRLASFVFVGILLGSLAGALFMPRKYEAEMTILVNRDRVDAVVTPDRDAPVSAASDAVVTEEDLNSEVELLKSRDLLEQVVLACRLEPPAPSGSQSIFDHVKVFLRMPSASSETARRATAVESLEDSLIAEPLKKTNLIRVTYASRDPEVSAHVLQTLATLYQEKHAAVHRPEGTYGFFDEQADRYQKLLRDAESRLTAFDGQEGVVDAVSQEQLALQELSTFESEAWQEEAEAAAARQRGIELQRLAASTPERQTTQMRNSGNAELLAQMQTTLLSLELKQSDMKTKYADSYPPLAELSIEIAETQKAIAAAEQSPVQETTTDRVPVQDWIATELAKAQADEASMKSQAAATQQAARHYRDFAVDLDVKGTDRADLVRDVKTAEENYQLYQTKREAARISDALDSQRIVNASIAEAATVPALPALHLGWLLLGGFFSASVLGVGSAYAADSIAPGFRSPDELGDFLDLQVLASIPAIAVEGTSQRGNRLLR